MTKPYDSTADTQEHISTVKNFLKMYVSQLNTQVSTHDNSKLEDPEKKAFDEYTPKLKTCTFMSDEYKRYLKELKPALDHHYASNRHHPEHFENGIHGMTLIDLTEHFIDCLASSKRHDDGDIFSSIDMLSTRFGYSDVIVSIFKNTAREIFGEEPPKE